MANRVLLVDPDVVALAAMATSLRQRGFKVSLANGTQMACERAKTSTFDAVIASSELADTTSETLGILDALAVETGRAPPLLLLVDALSAAPRKEHVLRADIDEIFARLLALQPPAAATLTLTPPPSPTGTSSLPPPSAVSGVLARTPLRELILALAAEKKTGALAVTTSSGAGEISLQDGELVDAVYMRLNGRKALCRLLGEEDGAFSFFTGRASVMRRITTPVADLVKECEEQVRDTRRLLAALGDMTTKALFATEAPAGAGPQSGDLSPQARALLARLRVPATIAELLDDLPASDSDLLRATMELDRAGRIKLLTQSAQRVSLAGTDELHLLCALAARARLPGFEGAARLVFAGTPGRLAVFAHTALCLADTVGAEVAPTVPVPHTIATMKLGDDMSVDLVALPLVPAYAPLWPMALAGSAVVVRLDDAAQVALDDACAAAEVEVAEAALLVGSLDEGNAAHVASLVRAALESAAR